MSQPADADETCADDGGGDAAARSDAATGSDAAATTTEPTAGGNPVAAAVDAFEQGEPVLVHDFADREGETDMVYPADVVGPDDVARLRNDAGGLVCVAVADVVADALDLPFLANDLDHPAADGGDVGYDDRSSFSLPVNHRETFTGITDEDRARTVSALAEAAVATERGAYDAEDFAAEFRTPGHVHLLRGAADGLAERQGHTELGLALAAAAGRAPAVVVCEMLDDATGGALAPADAREYAERTGLAFVEGSLLVDALE